MTAELAARLALAAVFAIAGVRKLANARGFREALLALGTPRSMAPALSLLIPAAELLIAAGLCIGATARVAATAALGLLLVFSVVIARSLARGERPDCYCFGQLNAGPVGQGTLARNFVFALLAAFVLI